MAAVAVMESAALKMLKNIILSGKINYFLSQVDDVRYIPGRIRFYVRNLINNSQLEKEIVNYLSDLSELKNFTVNIVTGSILIEYDPAQIRANGDLARIEKILARRYGRR